MPRQRAQHVPAGYVELAGSERRPLPGARRTGPADPNEMFTVTVRVRRRPGAPAAPDHAHWIATPPGRRNFITHDEFSRTYGAAPADLEAVAQFARKNGLTVAGTSIAGRTATLSGTVRQMSQAFAVDLGRYESEDGAYRGRDGFVHVPRELSGIVRAVFGLDNRQVGFRNNPDPSGTTPLTVGGPTVVAQAYGFPQAPPDASSQRIGVVEFATGGGGGWTPTDVTDTLQSWLLATSLSSPPKVIDVGTGNSGTSGSETILDICTASVVAPGATIQVYWGADPTSAQDWFTTIDRIWHNPQKGDPPSPQIVSISWTLVGGDDVIKSGGTVSSATIDEISADFQDMANAGITILVASGDGGSLGWNDTATAAGQGGSISEAHVAYPASDPWVTACGGTTLSLTPMGAVDQEWAWNDTCTTGVNDGAVGATGGGISVYFNAQPPWQAGVVSQMGLNPLNTGSGRGVPDVAGNASLNSGYTLSLNSTSTTNTMDMNFVGSYCGTSAVAPLYAGLVAMINARLGYSIGFLNPTLYAFRNAVCRDINDVPDAAQGAPPNNQLSGTVAPGYQSGPGWDACTGLGVINPAALIKDIQLNFYFVVDKSTFGVDEVTDNPSWPSAFWLFLEGYTPAEVASSMPSLGGAFTTIPGLTITPDMPTYDVGNTGANANVVQRIRFPFDVQFTTSGANSSLPAFPAAGMESLLSLSATITIGGNQLPLTPTAEIELVGGADPYFTNVNPDHGNYFYLSQDLRVFTITAGTTIGSGTGAATLGMGGVPDAYTFIQTLITYLNNQYGYPNTTSYSPPTDPAGPDPLDSVLPLQTGALTGDSSVTPGTSSEPNYNFAIARVRLKGAAGTTTSPGVSVFFRLFSTQTNDTDFIDTTATAADFDSPNVTYPTTSGMPTAGTDMSGTVNGCTLPFFATENYDASPTDYDVGGANNQPIAVPTGQDYVWAFFGCFLNVYDPGNVIGGKTIQEWLAGGTHHCLVAQIAYAESPIAHSGGVVASPDNNDKLAQRNLQITPSGNPGFPATHRIPQTFDLRPSPARGLAAGRLAGYPDELMIDWGEAPDKSRARIYWPAVQSSDVLALAARLYPNHLLSAVDAHTVECRAGGRVVYVPVPAGGDQSFAGLLTVELPGGVRYGNDFEVVVRRITSRRPVGRQLAVTSAVSGSAAATSQLVTDWRYVVGTFTIRIPVQQERTILPGEEHLLAILKWRLGIVPATNRWRPVLRRYIDYVSARVNGMGGNAGAIPAAPSGYYPSPSAKTGHGGSGRDHGCTGKIVGLVYDSFGDFEGFLLETERGEERSFKSTEAPVEALVRSAWEDRILVTVVADHHRPERVASIVLRRAPHFE
jgi:Pro-kumamolisin, activation domain